MQYDNCNISALYQYLSIYPLQYTSPSCRYSPLSDVRVVREELVEDDYVRRRRIMCSVSMHFSSGPTAAAIADYLQMITLENLQQQFRRPKHCFRWISSRFSKMLYSCCRQGCSCEGGGAAVRTAAAAPLPLLCARYLDDGHTRCTKGLNSFGVQIVGNQDQNNSRYQKLGGSKNVEHTSDGKSVLSHIYVVYLRFRC